MGKSKTQLGAPYAVIRTGRYVGVTDIDKQIVGLGFRPIAVFIWQFKTVLAATIAYNVTNTFAIDGTGFFFNFTHGTVANLEHRFVQAVFKSLDNDGFTVAANGELNLQNETYDYLAFGYASPNQKLHPESHLCRIATGLYVGDGSRAIHVSGLGFRPKFVVVMRYLTLDVTVSTWSRLDTIPTNICYLESVSAGGEQGTILNGLISLDDDGFTADVSLGPNVLNAPYVFLALG